MDSADPVSIAERYRRSAELEAHGRSPLYEALALGVAEDRDLLTFLLSLPESKRQPNLLFGVIRHLFGVVSGPREFRTIVLDQEAVVRSEMLARSTQTNEPARCAVLMPFLARLPQPIALLEVGASAGLCLYPDAYAYDYGTTQLRPGSTVDRPPTFRCRISDPRFIPDAYPRIAWRAGLDLNPIDPTDPGPDGRDGLRWLRSLVWPEQTDRAAQLDRALELAAGRPPVVRRGDLRDDLAAIRQEAPQSATLVLFHTAVLAYLDVAARRAFGTNAEAFCDVWISNESPRVFPDLADRAGQPRAPGQFLLAINGTPVAWTDPHGSDMTVIGPPAPTVSAALDPTRSTL